MNEYYQRYKLKLLETHKVWQSTHKDWLNEYKRKYRASHPEYVARQNARQNEYNKNKYKTDINYRIRQKAYHKSYRPKHYPKIQRYCVICNIKVSPCRKYCVFHSEKVYKEQHRRAVRRYNAQQKERKEYAKTQKTNQTGDP